MGKHETPEWMDEFLERHELEDLEELYDFLRMDRPEFWQEFLKKPTEETLERWIEEAIRHHEYLEEYRDIVGGRESAIVRFGDDYVVARVRRKDGVVQKYKIGFDKLKKYRVARKGGYLWR